VCAISNWIRMMADQRHGTTHHYDPFLLNLTRRVRLGGRVKPGHDDGGVARGANTSPGKILDCRVTWSSRCVNPIAAVGGVAQSPRIAVRGRMRPGTAYQHVRQNAHAK
jgi:hypothetical protein